MLPWKYPGPLARLIYPQAIFDADPTGNRIYLTYDDGPDLEVTPKLLEILAPAEARATFFVVASHQPWWAEKVQQISGQGHQIALHGLSHRTCYFSSNDHILGQLVQLQTMLLQIGVQPLKAFRPPYGQIRPDTVAFLKRHGIVTVLWSSIPGDYRAGNGERLYRRALRDLKPGSILALHDGTLLRPAPVLKLTHRLLIHIRECGCKADALSLPPMNSVDSTA